MPSSSVIQRYRAFLYVSYCHVLNKKWRRRWTVIIRQYVQRIPLGSKHIVPCLRTLHSGCVAVCVCVCVVPLRAQAVPWVPFCNVSAVVLSSYLPPSTAPCLNCPFHAQSHASLRPSQLQSSESSWRSLRHSLECRNNFFTKHGVLVCIQ